MSTPDVVDALMNEVVRGRTVSVAKTDADSREIIATTRFKRESLELALSKDDYEVVMADFMRALAARSDNDLAVAAKADHFGWRIKVTSGLFGQRVSRIFVSRRHFELLEAELAARQRAKVAVEQV